MRKPSDKTTAFSVVGKVHPIFRRAGIAFPFRQAMVVDRSRLSAMQVEELLNTPALEVVELDATVGDDANAAPVPVEDAAPVFDLTDGHESAAARAPKGRRK